MVGERGIVGHVAWGGGGNEEEREGGRERGRVGHTFVGDTVNISLSQLLPPSLPPSFLPSLLTGVKLFAPGVRLALVAIP